MSARIYHWPGPVVLGVFAELATIAGLALEAFAMGDGELLRDCERWHGERRAVLAALRVRGEA